MGLKKTLTYTVISSFCILAWSFIGCTKKNVSLSMDCPPTSQCTPWVEDTTLTPCDNLVLNGSFEKINVNTCPNDFSQTYICMGLSTPNESTPDYFRCCANGNKYVGVPTSNFGNKYPYDGEAFAGGGISWWQRNYVEYLQLNLKQPLVVGKRYRFSMHVSLTDRSRIAYGPMGVAFSEDSLHENGYNLATKVHPAIEWDITVAEKQCWLELKGDFTADGAHKYLVVGVFRKIKDMTRTRIGYNVRELPFPCYYYYDALKLTCL